ncbi:MAG: response regulator [Nitrospirae bacterium]|nr:response regulator [Nitrospirota bacterium]
MESSARQTILLVDDEENILNALRRALRKEPYDILTATAGPEGLRLLEGRTVALVCSDHRMPEMSGVEFLDQVKRRSPETLRIMLTGYADIHAATEAINRGEVYRFISKPWDDEDLRGIIREAVSRYALIRENRELHRLTELQNLELKELNTHLERKVEERTREVQAKNRELGNLYQDLERGFMEFVRVFMGIVELKSPYLGGHSKRTAIYARNVSERLGLPAGEVLDIEIAALLQDIGTIGFPERMLKKREEDMDAVERALMVQHPVLGEDRLQHIPKLQPAGRIIRHHHERYDGRGYPDRLRGEEIPMGARIISVIEAYDAWVSPPEFYTGLSPDRAFHLLEKEAGTRFDPRLLQELSMAVRVLREEIPDADIVETDLQGLQEGMTLAGDLKTHHGLLLMARGETVRGVHLAKIQNFHQVDPIVSRILVFRPASKGGDANTDKKAVSTG